MLLCSHKEFCSVKEKYLNENALIVSYNPVLFFCISQNLTIFNYEDDDNQKAYLQGAKTKITPSNLFHRLFLVGSFYFVL